jgi:hypothetical protein
MTTDDGTNGGVLDTLDALQEILTNITGLFGIPGPAGPQGPPADDVWAAGTRPAPQFSFVVGAWEYSFPDKETARKVREKLMKMTLEGEL